MNLPKVRLTIATRNAHKTRELAEMLGTEFELHDLADAAADVPEVEETGTTFEENAVLKAVATSRIIEGLVLADDSGLEVDALAGAPGVYSARYAGVGATDSDNVRKLLAELRDGSQLGQPTSARFRCVLALASDGEVVATAEGKVEGEIASEPRGANGFGYDPIFVPAGFTDTFAELSLATKNRISHRANAMAEFLRWWRERAATAESIRAHRSPKLP